MKAVALVGGQGTRMRPLTFTTPKPLLPLCQRPLIWYTVERCKTAGIEELILSTGYKPQLFETVVGDRVEDVKISYVHETDPLGTAGGAKNCEALLDSTFIVFNGDVLTSVDLSDLIRTHESTGASVTIYLTEVEDPREYGVVPTAETGEVLDFIEKPSLEEAPTNFVNGGIYVIERDILALIPEGVPYSFERELFPKLLEDGVLVVGYKSSSYWLDVGTPAKYLQAHNDLMSGRLHVQPPGTESDGLYFLGEAYISPDAEVVGPVVIGDGVRVESEVSIKGPVSIGPDSRIEGPSQITRSVLLGGNSVGRNSVVEDSILGERAEIASDCLVSEFAVIGAGALVGSGNELRRGMRVWPGVEVEDSAIKF
ncbi:MAG: hypothetical protein C4318_04385 [Acidimicrobiia bacterium]